MIKWLTTLGQWIEDNAIPLFVGFVFGVAIVLLRISEV